MKKILGVFAIVFLLLSGTALAADKKMGLFVNLTTDDCRFHSTFPPVSLLCFHFFHE